VEVAVEARRQWRQKRQFHRHLLIYLLNQEREPKEILLQKNSPLSYMALLLPSTAPLQPQLMALTHPPEKAAEGPRKNKDSSELAEIIGNAKPGVPPIASKNTRFKNQSRNK
jgi:hypothetical protein